MTSEIIWKYYMNYVIKLKGMGDWDGWVFLDKYMVGTLIKTNFTTN